MKQYITNSYLFAGIFAFLVFCLVVLIIWTTGEVRPVYAQNNVRRASRVTMTARENTDIGRLRSLLASDGVSVADARLLPQRAENSKVVMVRFESAETEAGQEKGLLTRPPHDSRLVRLETKTDKGVVVRQRSLELSPNQVLVTAIGTDKQMLWWTLLPDPRLFYAETSDMTGKLSGQVLYKTTADLLVPYPDDERIAELRFYHPDWDGYEYHLQPIGSLAAGE
jgi:hypothetical protein